MKKFAFICFFFFVCLFCIFGFSLFQRSDVSFGSSLFHPDQNLSVYPYFRTSFYINSDIDFELSGTKKFSFISGFSFGYNFPSLLFDRTYMKAFSYYGFNMGINVNISNIWGFTFKGKLFICILHPLKEDKFACFETEFQWQYNLIRKNNFNLDLCLPLILNFRKGGASLKIGIGVCTKIKAYNI